jgi:phosphoglycerate kinase
MLTLDNFSFKGQRALIRVDFNVPLTADFQVADGTRIDATLPSLKKILADGGMPVVMSHLGRPKGPSDSLSLRHLVPYLERALGVSVVFASDCVGSEAEKHTRVCVPNTVVLLENLRFHSEEEAGNPEFAQALAQHGDCYINDAFGTAHRAHASTAVIAHYFQGSSCFGYVMAREIENVDKVLNGGAKPVTAVVGGSKVSSKIDILRQLMQRVDHLVIGGGMAFTFLRAQGGSTGSSLVEEDKLELALSLLEEAKSRGVSVHLPTDVVCADRFAADAHTQIAPALAIPDGWMGLDVGPKTLEAFSAVVDQSATLLWNGPLGVFEMEAFANGTRVLGERIAERTEAGKLFSLVGGGDSVSAVNQFGLATRVSYVSTGGGAMLEYLEGRVLPGIEAVLKAEA